MFKQNQRNIKNTSEFSIFSEKTRLVLISFKIVLITVLKKGWLSTTRKILTVIITTPVLFNHVLYSLFYICVQQFCIMFRVYPIIQGMDQNLVIINSNFRRSSLRQSKNWVYLWPFFTFYIKTPPQRKK
jgi:hypothetical protein